MSAGQRGGARVSAKLRVIEDCWSIYANATVPDDATGNVREFVRASFYAGVAFMFDTMMANCDDEESGAAMLDSVHAELDQYSHQLAAQSGVDLGDIRAEIARRLATR